MSDEHRNDARQLFDRYADEYQTLLSRSIKLSGESAEYFARCKIERIRRLCSSLPPRHVLDVGCGIGVLTELLGRTFPSARVTGLDLSPKSLVQAVSRCAGLANVTFSLYDGNALPSEINGVDLSILANVLHHVYPAARPAFVEGLVLPALLPDGRIVIFEQNPYNPLTRLAVWSCPLDRNAHLLSLRASVALLRRCQLRVLQRDYIIFFPRFLGLLRGLEERMGWLPFGAQYMVVARRSRFVMHRI